MDEFEIFRKEYSNIIFPGYGNNNPDKDKWLFLLECFSINPDLYNINSWKQYKGIIIWSSYWDNVAKNNGINSIKINGFPLFNRNYYLNEFKSFKNRINGISLICRHRIETLPTNITYKRLQIMENLNRTGKLVCHCYGKQPYGGSMYQSVIGKLDTEETFPSSLQKLQIMDNYRFNLALENSYHYDFSRGYITEKIFDAFRAKVVPIYYGCYNIEFHIPRDLFIDYRNFKDDIQLADYLANFPEDKYDEMIERAYEFDKQSRYGNIGDLKEILKKL